MKKRQIAFGLLGAMLLLSGCAKNQMQAINYKSEDVKSDDASGTCYEVFVRSFWDSNSDGIGDIKGLTEKLDYINDGDSNTHEDLGCDSIWLMPIEESDSYHKYDIKEYCMVDEEYGTIADFRTFVEEAHKRGIQVYLDMVLNHTSSEHPWFVAACEYVKKTPYEDWDFDECPELDYYHFSNTKEKGYEPLPGTDYFYEARFWSGMPDLNLDNAEVRKRIADFAKYWLVTNDVDGFRMDAVSSYYTDDPEKNIEFLTWFADTVKEMKPNAYLVGECWANSKTYTKYYASGVDSFFDFDFANSDGIIAGVTRGTSHIRKYAEACIQIQEDIQSNATGTFVDAPFYTNHDMGRSAGYYAGDEGEKTKFAMGLNLMMSGRAFLYYGEELGMKGSGKDENKRVAMYWDSKSSLGLCGEIPGQDQVEMKFAPYNKQKNDPYSIYEYTKEAIHLRNAFPAIRNGKVEYLEDLSNIAEAQGGTPDYCVLRKTYGDEKVYLIINASDSELTLQDDTLAELELVGVLQADKAKIKWNHKTLQVPAYGIAVLK